LRLQRAQLALAAALAATVPVSIFASEILLALSALVLIARLVRRQARLPRTAADTPLLAFAVWSLLSASFAASPARSHEDAKKLLLLFLFYLGVEVLTRGDERRRVLDALLMGGLALTTLMVVQHHFLGFDRLDRRPHGFLGHYMSASGEAMAVLLLAVARLAFEPRRARARDLWLAGLLALGVAVVAAFDAAGHGTLPTRLFVALLALAAAAVGLSRSPAVEAAAAALPLAVAPLAAWALVVSQTRGAWLGAIVGLAALALLRAPRLLLAVGAAVLALLLVHPAALRDRLTVADASSVDRYYMWQAGLDMIADRPVFGQGPGMILSSYPRYRWPEAPNRLAPHLHNNLLQFAAERGLPALAFFGWCALVVAGTALRQARPAVPRGRPEPDAAGALAVLAAVFAAGLFEYNLGDSEVLMLVLLAVAVPFALERARRADAPGA
jgi:O-antigen ligase